MSKNRTGHYGADDDIVDYILGITFEIWEAGGIELIHQYYDPEITVYGLDGVIRGAASMVEGTRQMLAAFPDRRLLGDDVIWSGSREEGYYSSHRVLSPMTNTGTTPYGPATGKSVRIMNIADCVVRDGVITAEWLMRDNHALLTQLGVDPQVAAARLAASRTAETADWMAEEAERLRQLGARAETGSLIAPGIDSGLFAAQVLRTNWVSGDQATLEHAYAPYAVLHRSPISLHSGRDAIDGHYAALRNAFSVEGVSVDHVATQPFGLDGMHIAARWTVAGKHTGNFLGREATGKPVFILGASHWRIVDDRIAVEWTVFDGVAILAQLV